MSAHEHDAGRRVEAIFVRHGQSNANARLGLNEPFAEIGLTPLGVAQAEAVAAQWTVPPSLIVQSPFLRARMTAAPTIRRFPQVPVETWAVEEFTFWDPVNWEPAWVAGGGEGLDSEERTEEVARYWRVGDPAWRQGGAETFAEFSARAAAVFSRLESLAVDAPVLLFTHGHFMQALRQIILNADWSVEEKMLDFRRLDAEHWVANCERISAIYAEGVWRLE